MPERRAPTSKGSSPPAVPAHTVQDLPSLAADHAVRVLLVEDDPADARLIELALGELGDVRFELTWCDALKKALGHLDEQAYDVVLLDLDLPDAQGLATFERVRFVAPGLPVVVLSGRDDPALALSMVRAGAQDCLVKGDVDEVALARALQYAVERTRAHRAVKDAEERYRSLFHASLEGIALVDEGRFLDVNEAFTRIFRERRTGLIGRPVVELVGDEGRATFPERLARASGAPFEVTARRGDGIKIEALFVVRPHIHRGRKCLILVARDVTRARETERRLAENERWFRTIAEQASDIIMVIAPDGRHTFVSPAVERLLGRHPGDLLGRTPYGLVHPDDHARVRHQYRRALERPGRELQVRYRVRHADGHHVDVEARGVNRADDRTVRGMIVSIRDISDQTRAESALRDSEKRFRTLFENATVGLYRSTPEGRILLVNPALARMTGFDDPSEVMGRNVEEDELVGPLYDRDDWVAEMVREGSIIGLEGPWRRRDGSTLWVRESATTVRGPDGTVRFFEGVVEDITDQKEAEEEIMVHKTLLEAQQEASTDGIVVVARDGRIVSANTRFIEMWDLDDVDVRNGDARAVLDRMLSRTEDPETFKASVLALADDPDQAMRDEVRLADGSVFERYSTPLCGPGGAHYGRAWFFHDSTDRIRTEALLARLADQQKMVLDAAGEGIFGLNLKGNISFVNPAAARTLGYATKDLIGCPAHVLFDPGRRPADGTFPPQGADIPVYGPLHDGEVHERIDERFLRADGTTVPVDLVCTPLREHGRIVGSVVVFSDITQRKRAEEKFRSLLESTPDPMVIFDSDGQIVLVNEQVRRVFGYEAGDLTGRHVGVLAPRRMRTDHPFVRAVGGSLATEQATAAHEVRVRRADGSEFSADISLSPLQTEDGVLVISAIRDITDRLVAEEALRQRSEEMESFAYAVSHDLRTPLVSLDWLVEELRDTLDETHTDENELIRRIQRNIESMDDLVNALLDLARIGQEDSALDASADLGQVVGEVVDGLAGECARRGITVDVVGPLPVVRADPVRMTQVFSNLVGNAVKFVEDATGHVQVRAHEQIADTGAPVWRIEVQDNGPGVPTDYKERIFRLFERAPDPLGRPIGGTGVGLALARKVVRHYGGELDVRDARGGGSVFFLDIPGDATRRSVSHRDVGTRPMAGDDASERAL